MYGTDTSLVASQHRRRNVNNNMSIYRQGTASGGGSGSQPVQQYIPVGFPHEKVSFMQGNGKGSKMRQSCCHPLGNNLIRIKLPMRNCKGPPNRQLHGVRTWVFPELNRLLNSLWFIGMQPIPHRLWTTREETGTARSHSGQFPGHFGCSSVITVFVRLSFLSQSGGSKFRIYRFSVRTEVQVQRLSRGPRFCARCFSSVFVNFCNSPCCFFAFKHSQSRIFNAKEKTIKATF